MTRTEAGWENFAMWWGFWPAGNIAHCAISLTAGIPGVEESGREPAPPPLIAGQNDSWRVLVDSDELEGCAGDADQLMALIESGVQTD